MSETKLLPVSEHERARNQFFKRHSIKRDPFAEFMPDLDCYTVFDADFWVRVERALSSPYGKVMIIIGDAGYGKTAFLQALIQDLPPSRYKPIFVPDPRMSKTAFLRFIAQELGIDVKKEKASRNVERLTQLIVKEVYALRRVKGSKTTILLIDEAHLLFRSKYKPTLITFQILTDRCTDSKEGSEDFKVIMVGLPVLNKARKRYAKGEMLPFEDRVGLEYELPTLSEEKTRELVQRLMCYAKEEPYKPDADIAPFSERSVKEIYKLSGGIPREIKKICQLSIFLASRSGKGGVKVRHIQEAWGVE